MSNKSSKWLAHQKWENVLFMHWPVSPEELRPHVPEELEIDTFDGKAWISLLVYLSRDSSAKRLGQTFTAKPFTQINVRTYVKYSDDAGVYFFSVDADHFTAVKAAKKFVHLPYYYAEIDYKVEGETVNVSSERAEKQEAPLQFSGRYTPVSPAQRPPSNSLSYWLTARNGLWKVRSKKVYCASIEFVPWELQEADVHIDTNQLLDYLPVNVDDDALVHYAGATNVYFYPFEKM
ncbi:YqjF family protein [Alkalicoccus halolimnae]|uniref:DUF2071 domain-containing protein n=1 Tax=Alkalicoccus halolimnae TaxID=1667239 RepID=A0A5C7F616_9BACI|nr:DUF2071 domain-containing protein [Alkalicoccus halolimnae]TXF86122.1 DUF2071 domain-containing protein [Alkalicoccus halolimnae]